jgi:hypothetical protein
MEFDKKIYTNFSLISQEKIKLGVIAVNGKVILK